MGERAVKVSDVPCDGFRRRPDDDTVGTEAVSYGGAFGEELRIRHHVHIVPPQSTHHHLALPTGTVDLVMTTAPERRCGPISSATC